MSSITEELADKLAIATIKAAEDMGEEELITDVSTVIGASSTTTQEAFMTAIRVRLSEKRARKYLAERIEKGPKNPDAQKKELGSGPMLNLTEDG